MDQDQVQYERMTGTPIPRLVGSLAVPTIISMLITGIYNLADTYFVSCLKSDSATAAVGVVFSLMALIQAVGFTLGMGSGSLVSRLLGQQRREDAEEILASGFAAALVFGLAVTVLGLSLMDPLMLLLGSTQTVLPYARSYAQYIVLGAPVMAGAFVLNNCLRAEGHAVLSMVGLTTGGILNMVLDPLFIFGLHMEVAGAAIATLISQCVSFCILLTCYLTRKSVLLLSAARIARRPGPYRQILATGMASFFRQGLASVATVALNRAASVYGDAAMAAMTVVTKITMLSGSALIGFGQGYQPVAGYNYGAKRYDRVREAFAFTARTGTLVAAVLGAIVFLAAGPLVGLFSSGESSEMQAIGTAAMRAQCLGLLFQPIGMFSNMTFQTVGRTREAAFLACCRQGICFFPLIWLLPMVFKLTGVEITQAVSDILTALICVPFLLRFFRQLRDLEAAQSCAA